MALPNYVMRDIRCSLAPNQPRSDKNGALQCGASHRRLRSCLLRLRHAPQMMRSRKRSETMLALPNVLSRLVRTNLFNEVLKKAGFVNL